MVGFHFGVSPKWNIQCSRAPKIKITSASCNAADLAEEVFWRCESGSTPLPIGLGKKSICVLSSSSRIIPSAFAYAAPFPITTRGAFAVLISWEILKQPCFIGATCWWWMDNPSLLDIVWRFCSIRYEVCWKVHESGSWPAVPRRPIRICDYLRCRLDIRWTDRNFGMWRKQWYRIEFLESPFCDQMGSLEPPRSNRGNALTDELPICILMYSHQHLLSTDDIKISLLSSSAVRRWMTYSSYCIKHTWTSNDQAHTWFTVKYPYAVAA